MENKPLVKTHLGISYISPANLQGIQISIFNYAMSSYNHCIPCGSFTWLEYAEHIKRVYSLENPVNQAVVNLLESLGE